MPCPSERVTKMGWTPPELANSFSYLPSSVITPAWTAPANRTETVCVMFDQGFWDSIFAANAPGTPLAWPAARNEELHIGGLRTLRGHFMDDSLYGIERAMNGQRDLYFAKLGKKPAAW